MDSLEHWTRFMTFQLGNLMRNTGDFIYSLEQLGND